MSFVFWPLSYALSNEKSRIICMKRDFTLNLTLGFVCLKLKFTRNFPLHSFLQSKSKSNNNKMRNSYSYFNYLFNDYFKSGVKQWFAPSQKCMSAPRLVHVFLVWRVQNYYFFSKPTNIFSLFSIHLAEKCKYFCTYHIIMILKSPFLGIVSFNRKSYLCTQNQKELKIKNWKLKIYN